MNTTATVQPHRTTVGEPDGDARPVARAIGLAIIAFVLMALLPQLVIGDADWLRLEPLIRWTSLGLPLALLALGALLWRTRGGHRAVLVAYLVAVAAMAIDLLVRAAAGAHTLPESVGTGSSLLALALLHVAVLDAIGRAAWAGAVRALLGVIASWPFVALALGTLAGEGAIWLAAFVTLGIGLIATGTALAIRPSLVGIGGR